jgi:hypothetical protein
MTEEEAVHVATAFIAQQWGRSPELIGVRPPSRFAGEWTVLYKTVLPGGDPDEVVDGPTVVLVDPRTSVARFLVSM